MNGADFGGWFLRVSDQLRGNFPEIKIGFPGLSSGRAISGRRAGSAQFLHEAEDAVENADWVGLNCYWMDMAGLNSHDGCGQVASYRKAFPHKLLFVTEFNNPSPTVSSEVKARQYLAFKRKLEDIPGVGAIFCYALSSKVGNDSVVWRSESGEEYPLVKLIGNRDACSTNGGL